MNICRKFIDIDKYIDLKPVDTIFNFKKYPKLKICFKFNKTYSGTLLFYNKFNEENINCLELIIKRNGTNLKSKRTLYVGINDINIINQIYKVNAFNSTFLINISRMTYEYIYISESYRVKNLKLYSAYIRNLNKFITRDSHFFLDKYILFNEFKNSHEILKLVDVLDIFSNEEYLFRYNPSKMYKLLELLSDKLYYRGFLNDYLDGTNENLNRNELINLIEKKTVTTGVYEAIEKIYHCMIICNEYGKF